MTDSVTIEYVEEDGKRYAVRNGERFEVCDLDQESPPKAKRKAFKPEFATLPLHWIRALKGASGATYELAIAIRLEAFRCEWGGGEIVLSAEMAGMPHTNRHRAAKELEGLGLIKLSREGNHAPRVILK